MKRWKSHESTFPMLSKMACNLLTPPMSTIALKSTFSIAANIIEDRRTRLAPKMFEGLGRWTHRAPNFEVELKNLDINKDKDVQENDKDEE